MPVYNEINTIQTIIERVQDTGLVDELLVIDDGSTDGTREFLCDLNSEGNVLPFVGAFKKQKAM